MYIISENFGHLRNLIRATVEKGAQKVRSPVIFTSTDPKRRPQGDESLAMARSFSEGYVTSCAREMLHSLLRLLLEFSSGDAGCSGW